VIVVVLMTYVVPQIAGVFTSSKRALPVLTVAMLAISGFVRHWGWAVALLAVGGSTAFVLARRGEAFRERSDAALLRLPLVGRLVRGYNAARFGGTLAMLAGAGVPILRALQAAAETLGNRAMRSDALDALVQVREGAPLASALAGKKRFPGLLAMFARLGEQTGQLPLMLGRASAQLSAEVQRRALAVATLLERCSSSPWPWSAADHAGGADADHAAQYLGEVGPPEAPAALPPGGHRQRPGEPVPRRLLGPLNPGAALRVGLSPVFSADGSGARVWLAKMRAATMPTSYRMHIGIASASCEITSGGVTTAATMKAPTTK